MVTINYQTFGKDFSLRLRLYQEGETRYINVNKLLRGDIKKKHWNVRKQCFNPSAPYCDDNNKALADFKKPYEDKAQSWKGSVADLIQAVESPKGQEEKVLSDPKKPTMHELFFLIIRELKDNRHPDGTLKGTFECYEKAERKLMAYCEYQHIQYPKLLVSDITPQFVNSIFDWVKTKCAGKGFINLSKMLHATLVRAQDRDWFDMSTLRHIKWAKKPLISSQKYHTLTTTQLQHFSSMSYQQLPSSANKILYRDFCLFMLYTGASPCDIVSLRYDQIKKIDGTDYFVFKRRKIEEKQSVPCSVPINTKMREIMERQSIKAKDGYVFPIRNKYKLKTQLTNNGDIKKFIQRCNSWLKKLGRVLGCDFPLHLYTFRHTAITRYLSNDVPVIYVANMMGTSVKNCEQIYYNNHADTKSRDKVLSMIKL